MRLSIIFFGFLIIGQDIIAIEQKNLIMNEKTFSGPMGMGLSKSYELEKKKICIYNTINGQKKIILNNNEDICPMKLNKQD
jgi:hypothetical protein